MSIEATGNKIVDLHPSSGGGGGSSNYNELTNKPQINSVTLTGNKTSAQLGLQDKLLEDGQRTIIFNGNVISVNGNVYYNKDQIDSMLTGMAKTYIVETLPATPTKNTYYMVGNDTDGYTLYYYDENLRQAVVGNYELDLTIYAKKSQKIGTTAFQGDVTVANLFNDLKDYTGTITNKTIDADDNTIQDLKTTNFAEGVVLTEIPESGATDTTIATVKAIKTEIDKKQDKITTTIQSATPADTDSLSDLSGTTNTTNKRWTFAKIWEWIETKLNLSIFASGTLTPSRVLYTDSNTKLATSTITPTKLGYLANVKSDIQEQIDGLIDKVYPVGSIYISTNSTNPGSIFGGTWAEFGKGKTLIGVDTSQSEFNSVEKTGGGKEAVAKITIGWANGEGNFLSQAQKQSRRFTANINIPNFNTYQAVSKTRNETTEVVTVNNSGTLNSNALPPYITVYYWKRTA